LAVLPCENLDAFTWRLLKARLSRPGVMGRRPFTMPAPRRSLELTRTRLPIVDARPKFSARMAVTAFEYRAFRYRFTTFMLLTMRVLRK
jgi:hypothetical protein